MTDSVHTYRPALGALTGGEDTGPSATIDYNEMPVDWGVRSLCNKLLRFYSNPQHFDTVERLQNGDHELPVRYIDYFVTTYAKKYNVSYMVERAHGTEPFHVNAKYHCMLNSGLHKRNADPFRRGPRIVLHSADGKRHIETTVAQLSFFLWAIENKVLEYTLKNKDNIGKDLKEHRRLAAINKARRKRGEPHAQEPPLECRKFAPAADVGSQYSDQIVQRF